MITTKHALDFEDVYNDPPLLKCPVCGETNLHHGQVVVFSREEDAKFTQRTEVNNTGAIHVHVEPSSESANPSSRRHGLSIHVWCEQCPSMLRLTIAQHKGSTQIEWEVTR